MRRVEVCRIALAILTAGALAACDDGPADDPIVIPGVDGGAGGIGGGGAGGEGGAGGGEPAAATFCEVQAEVFEPHCNQCHNGSVNPLDLRGLAAAERIVDQPGIVYPGHTLVVPGAPQDSLLYLKAAGIQPADGGGSMPPGASTPADALAVLEGWIRGGAPTECAVEPPPGETVALAPVERAIRASMAIRGTRPTVEELEQVIDDPTAIEALVDTWLDSPAFGETIKDLHDDHLMVRSEAGLLFPPWPPLDQLPERERDVTAINKAVMEAPLELISWVVQSGRPYTDILTTDVVLANRTMRGFWGEDYTVQGVRLGLQCEDEDVDGHPGWSRCRWLEDGRGGAGVLSSGAYFLRWQSAGGNLHRGRANAVSTAFLCYDFLARDVSLDGLDIDFADPDVVANAVRDNAACATCHDTLDPLASFFFGYRGRFLVNQLDEQVWPLPWYIPPFAYQPGGRPLRNGRSPALFGEDGETLADLGRLITAHPDFARCTARRFYAWLDQSPLESVPDATVETLAEDFVASGHDAKALVRAIVLSDAFAASHSEGEEGSEAVVGLKKIRAGQARRTIEGLTGLRWQALATFELPAGGIYGLIDLVENALLGYKVLAGGTDGFSVLEEAHTFNAPAAAFWAVYAAEAAGEIVESDFDTPRAERRLLRLVDDDTNDAPTLRAQLAELHLRLFGEAVAPDDPAIDDSLALLGDAFQRNGGSRHAWKVLLTAMFQDIRFTHY